MEPIQTATVDDCNGHGAAKDTHLTNVPVRPGIDAQTPSNMPRAEDDEDTRASSPEFHYWPGSGKDTAHRLREL